MNSVKNSIHRRSYADSQSSLTRRNDEFWKIQFIDDYMHAVENIFDFKMTFYRKSFHADSFDLINQNWWCNIYAD